MKDGICSSIGVPTGAVVVTGVAAWVGGSSPMRWGRFSASWLILGLWVLCIHFGVVEDVVLKLQATDQEHLIKEKTSAVTHVSPYAWPGGAGV